MIKIIKYESPYILKSNFSKERMSIMPYKNKRRSLRFLLFLILCTITFSAENIKKIEKVNLEGLVSNHEIIYHTNLLKNNSKENIDKKNFELENESE